MLKAENIRKNYGKLEVLKGIDLEIRAAEVTSIVGASGAGKSTLLHILGGLDRADAGNIYLNDTLLSGLNDHKLSGFRNESIGFIFQFHNLLPEFTAFENVCLPAFIGGKSRAEVEKRAKELFALLGISKRAEHKPSELSGGEQQRTAVARALINSPEVVLADEPSGNLDSKNAEDLHRLFFRLRDELGQTFVIVTHNNTLADTADRKIELSDGKVLSDSSLQIRAE